MLIIYQSKTGFTKKYADMLAEKTNLRAIPTSKLEQVTKGEEIIFLGWIRAGRIQGFKQLRKYRVVAVCASGTARTAEPDPDTVIARNKIGSLPFFYLRGGCFPLKELKGIDKIMLSFFLKMLKRRKDKDENLEEAISIVENGFNGVKEENLEPVIAWLSALES